MGIPSTISAVLLLVGCAHRGSTEAASVCPAPPIGSSVEEPPLDSSARVIAVLFPKRLESIRECRRPSREPTTWVEVDDRELENLDAGQFVPVIEQRERGHFTDGADQIRFVVRIDNCQKNLEPLRVEAVFPEWALSPNPLASERRLRPIMIREWRGAMPRGGTASPL